MRVSDIYNIADIIDINDRERLFRAIKESNKMNTAISDMTFGMLFASTYLCVLYRKINKEKKIVVYGAGKIANSIMPGLLKLIRVDEIWDMYSKIDHLYGINVKKPSDILKDTVVIVAIDNQEALKSAYEYINNRACKNVYHYSELINEDIGYETIISITPYLSEEAIQVFEALITRFKIIDNEYPPVILSVVPCELDASTEKISKKEIKAKLSDTLQKKLYLDESGEKRLRDCIQYLCSSIDKDKNNLFENIEVFLRKLLYGSVKTRYRFIRMKDDFPYDHVAVIETLVELLNVICKGNNGSALEIIRGIKRLNQNSIYVLAAEVYFCCWNKDYSGALNVARVLLHKGPDDFVANEAFYYAASECKKNDVPVDEPICELNLNDYFCWCGINYAWCGGYDYERDDAAFSPCFRPSCIAAPRGDFFTGNEWIEFRKSLVDGTFKYCQKSQCPNLVGGWLPRKDKIEDKTIIRILEGDISSRPSLDEIHLSYDSHCNLKCPSCRTEFCTNTKEQNEKHDEFYLKYLQPYVNNAKHLCLQGCGEAMLSPHSRMILKSLSDEKYDDLKVELRTNVTSITPQNWESIGYGRKRIRHIAASIDAATKKTFEKLRYPANWEIVLDNLHFIQSLRKEGEIDLFEFHVVIQKENLRELVDIIKLASGLNVDVVTFSRLVNWMGKSEEEYLDINPFWIESEIHSELKTVMKELVELRDKIENGVCEQLPDKRKMYINIHFIADPNDSYDPIRYGRLKIR